MEIIKTTRQLGQAVKNVQRLRQILAVFAKHGFADIIDRMDLGKYLPARLSIVQEAATDKELPVRLREAFEALGPTFVKLGQLLSTRSDLLPESYIAEFTLLQDNVQPLDFLTVKTVIESELKKSLDQVYDEFSTQPLAAASIGQVHTAKLKSGESVVVKIQRPEIQKVIDQDISLLAFLSRLLEKYIPESRVANPSVIVDEFFRSLSYELNYLVEANNMQKMATNLSTITDIVIPKVYRSFSTQRILTLERLEGLRVNDPKALDVAGIDRKHIVQVGARAFFKAVLIDGLFHGDLHGGNLFVLPGNKLGIIDFGIVGRLSHRARDQLAIMVVCLINEDYETLCYQYAELGQAPSDIDFEGFQREVRNTISPYMGLSLAEMNTGRVLIEATKVAAKYQIKVPGDWMIVFKAIVTLEGMGRGLDPEFDLISIGQELATDLVKNQYSVQRLSRDFLWVGQDVASLAKILPRNLKGLLRKLASNDFAVELKIPELSKLRAQLAKTQKSNSLTLLSAALIIAGAIALQSTQGPLIGGLPAATVGFLSGALICLLMLFWGA